MDTKSANRTLQDPITPVLYLAFELSRDQWQLAFSIGPGQPARLRSMSARDLAGLQREVGQARRRFDLAESAPVRSCYEAGRDGFWLHRYLEAQGILNLVVDSASIEVSRRSRKAKTDRLDVSKLLGMLMRYDSGEKTVWRVVHVPSIEVEDMRHLHRQMTTLKVERTQHINRIKGLLAGQGVLLPVSADFLERLPGVRLWDGRPLPQGLSARLTSEYQRIRLIQEQLQTLEAQRQEFLRTSQHPCAEQVRQLMRLQGIGINSAWLYVMEFFAWRAFRNRREIGALAGLTPTPYQSGASSQEQGISKAGNRHVRAIAIEIAWCWLQFQPTSQLSRWYQERFSQGGSRLKRIGIVALARKLLIDLWRYLETGTVPEGAVLKSH